MSTEIELKNWRFGQTQAERLCAQLLIVENFQDVDPQCPLGGPDGRKDILCRRNNKVYVAGCYFPTTQKHFSDIREKFQNDIQGVVANSADGFVFFVNQHVSPKERKVLGVLSKTAGCTDLVIYHLERMRVLLDSPVGLGIRHSYLQIPLSTEEQTSFAHWSAGVPDQADQMIKGYADAFLQTYEPLVAELVPFRATIGESPISSTDISERLAKNEKPFCVLMVGPSGCGKSLTATQVGVDFVRRGGLVVLLRGMDYQNSFESLMRNEVRLLSKVQPSALFIAAANANREKLVILDGYNECSVEKRAELIRELALFVQEKAVNLIVTSQISLELSHLIETISIEVPAPSLSTKMAIACSSDPDPNVLVLLEALGTCLEARLVKEVGVNPSILSNRFALFDSFVRKRLGDWATDGITALAKIADLMADQIVFSLSIRDLDRFAAREQMPAVLIAELKRNGFLVVRGDRISFPHELYLNSFAAEAIIRSAHGDPALIVAAICQPRHADRRELIVGAIENALVREAVLKSTTHGNLIAFCMNGACGRETKEWAESYCHEMFRRIRSETERIRFQITEKGWMNVAFDETSLSRWSELDQAFFNAMCNAVSPSFSFVPILECVALLDHRLELERQRLSAEAKEKNIPLRSGLFSISYVVQLLAPNRSPALVQICLGLSQSFQLNSRWKDVLFQTVRDALKADALTPGQVYVMLKACWIIDEPGQFLAPIITSLIKSLWRTAPYHLRVELLHSAQLCWDAPETDRFSLASTIEAIPDTDDIGISTAIIEALERLGALEEDARGHVATVRCELREVLSLPESVEKCKVAWGIYYSQFDHPYSGAYTECIEDLDDEELQRFLIMAGKGNLQRSTLFTSILLVRLSRYSADDVGLIISSWTDLPDPQSAFVQDAVELFLVSHILLGFLGDPLQSNQEYASPSANVLAACGEILYWLNRRDLDVDARLKACRQLIDVLLIHFGASADALRLCEQAFRFFVLADDRFETSISKHFPKEIAEICRQCLRWPKQQVGFFRYADRDRLETLKFAVGGLGRWGTEMDAPLLQALAEDADLGVESIAALRLLDERRG